MGWDAITRVFEKVSNRSMFESTKARKPPRPTSTKDEDLCAFRTIITMLSYLQSPTMRLTTKMEQPFIEGRKELRVLDALSAVLIRQHEITAVVAQSTGGSNLQVLASVTCPSSVDPLLPPSPGAEPDGQGLWDRICANFTVAINPRESKINNNIDSLMNLTSLPVIGDHQDRVPKELVTAAQNNGPLLDVFLETCW
jgi:hypothetical protein